MALPARADSEEFLKENQKINKPRKGSAVLSVARVSVGWLVGRGCGLA